MLQAGPSSEITTAAKLKTYFKLPAQDTEGTIL